MHFKGEHIEIFQGDYKLLNAFDFTLMDGMCVALMGVNGSGKSTLLRSLCGLHEINNGQLSINDHKIQQPFPVSVSSIFSLVKPSPEFPALCTVKEFVLSGLLVHQNWIGLHQDYDPARLQYVLDITGTKNLEQRLMSTLSDGERQKVALSRAIMSDSSILLLDEPVSFLDIPSKKEIMKIIKEIALSGKIVVYSTHDPDSCFLYSTHTWLIKDQTLYTGTTGEMTEKVCSYFGI